MTAESLAGTVAGVFSSATHSMAKSARDEIELATGLGVKGDAHSGALVKHRSRVRKDPSQPNLRQVHLIHSELLDELSSDGLDVAPGSMGENILTEGIDLLGLHTGTILRIGQTASLEVKGLRNPCAQLDGVFPGLMNAVLDRDENGDLVRKSGVMSVVLSAGRVRAGDSIVAELPAGARTPLQVV